MNKPKGIIFAIITACALGLIPFFSVPLLTLGMKAQSILFYRNFLCFIVIALIVLVTRRKIQIPKSAIFNIVALSFIYVIESVSLVYSYSFIASGLATTVHYLYPIAVALAMMLFFKEKKSWKVYLLAIISLAGVGFLCINKTMTLNIKGILLAMSTIFTYAIYIVLLNKTTKTYKIDNLVLMFYLLLTHSILFAIFCLCTTGFDPLVGMSAWVHIMGLTLVSSVIATFSLLLAIKNAGPTITSILGSLETVVSMLVGIFCFNEHYNLNSFFGLVLIVFSVAMVIVLDRQKKQQTDKKLVCSE